MFTDSFITIIWHIMAVSDWCVIDNHTVLVLLTMLHTTRSLRAPVKVQGTLHFIVVPVL